MLSFVRWAQRITSPRLSLYKILFHFKPLLWSHSSVYSSPPVTGAGIAVHTNPCERLSVRVAVARVALRQCLRLRRVRPSLSVTTLRRVRLSLSVTPPLPAKPTLLQYYCTLRNLTPPPPTPSVCHTPYTIGDGNIV